MCIDYFDKIKINLKCSFYKIVSRVIEDICKVFSTGIGIVEISVMGTVVIIVVVFVSLRGGLGADLIYVF